LSSTPLPGGLLAGGSVGRPTPDLSRQPRQRRGITPLKIRPPSRPDLNKNASGKPGAVQTIAMDRDARTAKERWRRHFHR
jgi:hypothetical protein